MEKIQIEISMQLSREAVERCNSQPIININNFKFKY